MKILPSTWVLFVSSIIFFIAAWRVRRYLIEQGIQKGMTFAVVVFTFAFLTSFATGKSLSWLEHRLVGPQQTNQSTAPNSASPSLGNVDE